MQADDPTQFFLKLFYFFHCATLLNILFYICVQLSGRFNETLWISLSAFEDYSELFSETGKMKNRIVCRLG